MSHEVSTAIVNMIRRARKEIWLEILLSQMTLHLLVLPQIDQNRPLKPHMAGCRSKDASRDQQTFQKDGVFREH